MCDPSDRFETFDFATLIDIFVLLEVFEKFVLFDVFENVVSDSVQVTIDELLNVSESDAVSIVSDSCNDDLFPGYSLITKHLTFRGGSSKRWH